MGWSVERHARSERPPGRTAEAAQRTAAVRERVRELQGVLAETLAADVGGTDLQSLKRAPRRAPPLMAETDLRPHPGPLWAAFRPAPPGPFATWVGGHRRYARRLRDAEDRFAEAIERHRLAEEARQLRVARAAKEQADQQRRLDEATAELHARIDDYERSVRSGDRRAVSRYFQKALDRVSEPADFPRRRRVGYVPESTLLAVEWDLPDVTVVPAESSYRYEQRDLVVGVPRPEKEIRLLYQQLVAQCALRALHLVFGNDRYGVVDTVVFNGMVESVDLATGRTVRPCLITLRATREQFTALVLDQLDPVACVRHYFGAEVSRHPEELQPVEPVLEFDLADPRTIEPVDVVSELDTRPNLLELTPDEFEQLVHNLLTRMGLETRLFRSGNDGGIDCVAYDRRPITGGKFVVQAKLYTRTVPPSAVRDLFGTVVDAGATKGILITTSGFGPSSYQFANGKPLQLIDGTGLLALCHQHDIPARIVPRAG
ncbi:restriction endonuclease [Kribbella flavida DSM 17836]|uniref:Restriction endonuclease n=1 Tax=Kribbella flavida (strain DSM 17836 / JCM 10339 / NBRC 14399) TaxID=479435 RepID=D2PRL3_KRIFD|nr:restriction endonuclease [Kribbella flavida]ADB34931.1 restriction endonuclease [Kribbella flavida DSM 17836]